MNMKVSINSINSAGIRNKMRKDHFTTAELIGTFDHPMKSGADWTVRLYFAADSLVCDTNADPIWACTPEFDLLVAEYGINLDAAADFSSPTALSANL